MTEILKAPFPWFGGKSTVAPEVWTAFGDVANYVEPFFGSGAVLLNRPANDDGDWGTETINDLDGFVANFWRAISHDPEAVAFHADWPVNENDLHARHVWLIQQLPTLQARLEGDMDFYDAKIAGTWAWGICNWIGGGWCNPQGPWWPDENGMLVKMGGGVKRKLPHLGDAGQGVKRQLPHLGDAGRGVKRQLQQLGNCNGHGSITRTGDGLIDWFNRLAARLRRVRVCSGDWARITGPSVTDKHGLTGVFLDPPYADTAGRDANLYRRDCLSVAHAVREWAIANGDRPTMRIALCGYDGEHTMPDNWRVHEWKATGGYAHIGGGETDGIANAHRERIWFSPHCLTGKITTPLFGDL